MSILRWGLWTVASLATSAPAFGNCLPAKTFSSLGSDRYVYLHTPADAVNTSTSIVGRLWQPGLFESTHGECDESIWLYPTAGSHNWYIYGTLDGLGCRTGTACPSSELVVLVEDRAARGYFAVGRVDETPNRWYDFDYGRTGGDWNLVPIPPPATSNVGSGEVFQAWLFFTDPSNGFHGVAGAQASGTITAFLLYQNGQGVERANWNFVKRIPYTGGTTQAQVALVCPDLGVVRLATALEFDNGQVITHYVSGPNTIFCDTYPNAPGAVNDSGPGSLHVQREISGELTLTWGASCSGSDDYAVYEGELGLWDSHEPVTCSTGGIPTSTFAPSAFDRYYLVVPTDDQGEGWYGTRSDGTQRPRGPTFCMGQRLSVCMP